MSKYVLVRESDAEGHLACAFPGEWVSPADVRRFFKSVSASPSPLNDGELVEMVAQIISPHDPEGWEKAGRLDGDDYRESYRVEARAVLALFTTGDE